MKLGLGTAQFGMDYGVSNKQGQTPPHEVENILALADETGIDVLDTAAVYGNSESVLGKTLPANHHFRIITKSPVFKSDKINASHADTLISVFNRSLENLRQDSLYALLIHDADDLLAPGGELLIEAMRKLVASGLVKRIGVSVYTANQLERLLELFTPDVVQIPINPFDQRLIVSGHLEKLKNLGVEIHARSIFLQGLLLMELGAIPSYFHRFRDHLERYGRFVVAHGLSRIQAPFLFARQLALDIVLIGVCSATELKQNVAAFESPANLKLDFSPLGCTDDGLVNSSKWQV